MLTQALPVDQNPFATFVGQRTNSLIDRMREVDRTTSTEPIRRVRVGIKRWRTILQLVTVLMPARKKSNQVERSFQRLFKWAGAVRNCQLDCQLLIGMSLPVRFKKKMQRFLKKQEKIARKRLKKAIHTVRFKQVRKVSHRIEQLAPAIAPQRLSHQLSRFLDQESCAIEALLAKEVSPENLHSIRKHLKSLIEIGNVIRTITPDKSLAHLIKRAKTGQRRLGHWHDTVSLMAQLRAYMAKHACGLSPEKIRSLTVRLDTRTQRETKQICQQVDKLSRIFPLLVPWRTDANAITLVS